MVDFYVRKDLLRDPFVAALGHPGRPRVATTDVKADRGRRIALRDAVVDQLDVAGEALLGIFAARDDLGAETIGDEVGEDRIIDLDVPTAGGFQRGDLGAPRSDDIGEELFDIRISGLGDRSAPAVEVEPSRRRQRDFGHRFRDRGEVCEVADEQRFGVDDPADRPYRLGDVSRLVVRGVLERGIDGRRDLDAGQSADEIGVPVFATQLTVGDDGEPDLLLLRDYAPNRRVFDGAQSLGSILLVPARIEDALRAQETPDMVGTEKALLGGYGTHDDLARRTQAARFALRSPHPPGAPTRGARAGDPE